MKHANAILTETSHPAKPQNLGAAPSAGHTIRDRSAKQRAFGPVSASKPQPTLARLRDVLTDLKVHGTCRHVAYELLTYWEPGGTVFPSVKTLAEGIGVDRRIVRRHVARLERIGLWVRVCRQGHSNRYELQLPGSEVKPKRPLLSPDPTIPPPGSQDPPEVTKEVTSTQRSARTSCDDGCLTLPSVGKSTQLSARETCESCGRSWPAKFGTVCHACGDRPQKRSTTPYTTPSCFGRVRNCPQCHTQERGHEDTCQHCDWTREAWDARGAT